MEIFTVKHKPRLHEFLFRLGKEIGCYGEMEKSLRIMKAVLHALRDSIHIDNAIQVQSALPAFLKPLFQEGWKPFAEKHAICSNQNFIKEVCLQEGKMHHYDLPDENTAAERIRGAFKVLEEFMEPQKLSILKEAFPNELKYILKKEKAA